MTFRLYALDSPRFPPLLLLSFLSVILCVSPLLIFHLFLLFCHCQPLHPPLLADTCVPYIFERNRSSSSADNTNRSTSHLLQRLMRVIYQSPEMGFRMCVRTCLVLLPPPPHHLTVLSHPHIPLSVSIHLLLSLPPSRPPFSLRRTLHPLCSPCVSVSEDLVRSSVSLCVGAGEAGKE